MFVAALALHADEDAAVGEGFGEVTDRGDDFGAPAGKSVECRVSGGRTVTGCRLNVAGCGAGQRGCIVT